MKSSIAGTPVPISQDRLVLVEGADAEHFLCWLHGATGAPAAQFNNYGGIKDLRRYLAALVRARGFGKVRSIIIARDAESSARQAQQSVQDALRTSGLPVPEKCFQFTDSPQRVAIVLFPGCDDNGRLLDGTLEDLCVATVAPDPLWTCVDDFVSCAKGIGEPVTRPWKTRLHAYLAAKRDLAGLKLGEAANRGAWPPNHARLGDLARILCQL